MSTFDDFASAIRMRSLLKGIVEEEVNYLRPKDQFGTVYDWNIFDGTASVILDGDSVPIKARYTQDMRPTSTTVSPDAVDAGSNPNRVRISGGPGNYWITQFITGPHSEVDTKLLNPTFQGGVWGTLLTKRIMTTLSAGQPSAAGNTWYIGRISNNTSFGANATGHFRISIRHAFFTSENKVYEVPIQSNATAGQWRKLIPTYETGSSNGHEFGLEIKIDSYGVELRVRAVTVGGGWTPGGYDVIIEADGDSWDYETFSGAVEEGATTEPTQILGDTIATAHQGFLSPAANMPNRMQQLLTGGGITDFDEVNFYWSKRFIALGQGSNYYSKDGYFNIGPCVGGTSIPVYGSTATSVVTVAGGVPMASWDALYYEPPIGATAGFVESRLRIVNYYSAAPFEVPSHWILIANRNESEYPTPVVKIGDGTILGARKAFAYGANVASYGSTFAAGYRFKNGFICLAGLVKATAALAVSATLFTMPAGARPEQSNVYTAWHGDVQMERLNIYSTGVASCNTLALPLNAWLSLDGIMYIPGN